MEKTAAIIQTAYLPWKGFFEFVQDVDVFVFYDNVQYSKRGWINRNRIKSPLGTRWITVPVRGSTKFTIQETEISGNEWIESHCSALKQSYKSSPHWGLVEELIRGLRTCEAKTISQLNQHMIREICNFLKIDTELICSSEIPQHGRKSERLISILNHLGATRYISGPAAKVYIGNEFKEAGIELKWKDYSGYPEYGQLHGQFDHEVSVLDLIAMTGNDASKYIWGWRDSTSPSYTGMEGN